jgi:hypothetical protein
MDAGSPVKTRMSVLKISRYQQTKWMYCVLGCYPHEVTQALLPRDGGSYPVHRGIGQMKSMRGRTSDIKRTSQLTEG